MSDIKKWMKIMESVPATFPNQSETHFAVKRDATVMVDPRRGGGTGRFMHSTPTGAMIDVKGVPMEMAEEDWSIPSRDYEEPYRRGNDWFHMSDLPDTPGTQRDKPEFRPGDMVKIADVYGSVIGPGFGIFVAYSTSGTECIISFDSKEILVPTANVGSVLEQDAKDNFDEMDNDGNLSTLSFGSKNVKVEEPVMDQRDEFSKWMSAVEEALSSEAKPVAEDVPPMGQQCGCGAWDCNMCFPDQNEMPGMQGAMDGLGGMSPEVAVVGGGMGGPGMMQGMNPMGGGDVCPTCGHAHEGGGMDHEMEVEVPFEDGSGGGMGAGGMSMGAEPMVDEEPMSFDQKPAPLPRGQNGGVKLGHIVQKFVAADQDGEDSPLTYGEENLGEEEFDSMGDEAPGGIDPHAPQQNADMEFATQGDSDIEGAEDMMHKIMYMQDMGLSKSSQVFGEQDFQHMAPSQLKKAYDTVMGTVSEETPPQMPPAAPTGVTPPSSASMGAAGGGGSPASPGGNYAPGTAPTMPESIQGRTTMENVDKDVAAMLKSLKKYDLLKESVAPVLGMHNISEKKGGKPEWLQSAEEKAEKKEGKNGESDGEGSDLDESEEKNPWEKLASNKKDDEPKSSKTHKGGTVTKTDKGLSHKAADKKVDESVGSDADADVLSWMKRFSNLGNMKGYGR